MWKCSSVVVATYETRKDEPPSDRTEEYRARSDADAVPFDMSESDDLVGDSGKRDRFSAAIAHRFHYRVRQQAITRSRLLPSRLC